MRFALIQAFFPPQYLGRIISLSLIALVPKVIGEGLLYPTHWTKGVLPLGMLSRGILRARSPQRYYRSQEGESPVKRVVLHQSALRLILRER